jgi:hypothetical protein
MIEHPIKQLVHRQHRFTKLATNVQNVILAGIIVYRLMYLLLVAVRIVKCYRKTL